ncbi:PVC-type heme-binding CxxCH protein [Verrucomicrobium sp. BvORR106]|uniref:PVC-type heme-binding CxxCH protein n=1 Tax=Verrucomicrobium sp. BvORR106 TaxID=1403819 RepID=UPI00056F3DBA|nr:PVC-type heme-binding CxxCH protein [Verrucomicrobium sp. BvORR106]
MKNLLFTLIALCITLTAPAATGPVRVLFLGHENNKVHNSSTAAALLMQECGRDAIYFDFFTQPTCLNPETLARYDAVMLYANHDKITPEQFNALITFIESGGGFLPVHCGSACFGNEPRFAALVGARFKSHGAGVFKASTVDKAHPIMKGVAEYETWDESYVHDQHNPLGRKLLAEREREPWTWVREQGKGRVFYTASGHDNRTWSNTNFQLLLRNAILWAIGDARRVQWQAFVTQREPEKRERNPNVANYENRPEPITFQRPFTVKGSMERTQVPAGLHLELFAAEPNIAKPIALAWDERGRCWVAETGDYPHDVAPNGVGHDRIKICEDTNGDGRADKFTVFAEKLNIPTSLVLVNGGVIVAQPPRFLFLKDTNGDDKADVRQVIMEGWGIGDTHAQANNLHYGYDNWLHGCVGYSGFKGQVGGKSLAFTQGTYRFKMDGSELEFLHQFSNNSWGQSQNAAGDNFGGTANNAPIFYGGIPARVTPPGMRLMTAKRINVEEKVHAITPNYRQVDVFGGYTSAAGSAFIYSANLPPWLQGMAMVTEPTMKVVSLMDVQPQGAGYVANDGFNLLASSDEWLSPVFAEVGPDGAVWVADWQNFIIQHNPTPSRQRGGFDGRTGAGGAHENPLRDHARGRIYRVVWDQARPPAIRSLKGAATADLVRALGSDTQFWRLTAQRLLVEGRKLDAAPSLKSIVSGNSGHVGVIHALWTLHGLGALDPATHKAALEAKDPALRRNAIRALGTSADTATLFISTKVAADPDPATLLAALVKLAEFPPSPSWTPLVEQLRNDSMVNGDEWLREALKVVEQKHARPGGGTPAEAPLAGDVKRGEQVFYKHPAAACVLCHTLRGQGSTVGPALDRVASRFPAAYINESLLEPGKVLAKGFEALGASPMPPLGLVLKPQELEDVKAFLMTLK